jgi:hypothetical protein
MVVAEMCWFIRKVCMINIPVPSSLSRVRTKIPKGESYAEGTPTTIDYQCDIPVSSGPEPQTEIEIFCNDDPVPPVHCTSRATCIARLSLNLDRIPMSTKTAAGVTWIGNHRYYCLTGGIEATYGSAMITYKVKLGGESAEFRV